MQNTTKVGKYINNDIGYLSDLKLNNLLNNILDKINTQDNQIEKNDILKKLKLTRLEVFKTSAFIINYILNYKNYKEKMIELSEKLGAFIDKDEINYSTIIDFSNEISSKMKFHSTYVANKLKDNLTEEELRELIEKINNEDRKIIDRVLFDYRKWIEKVKDDKELYNYLNEYEMTSKILIRELLEIKERKIEEDKARADRIYAIDVDRRINIYNQKHKSIHRVYNRSFD